VPADAAAPPAVGAKGDAVDATVHTADVPVVKGVGPTNNQPLPSVDKPAEAPDQINDVKSGGAQVKTGATATGKNKSKKAPYDSKDESSSKHKKKKGLAKVNPF
jgi:outer membrane protein assembly factor BamD